MRILDTGLDAKMKEQMYDRCIKAVPIFLVYFVIVCVRNLISLMQGQPLGGFFLKRSLFMLCVSIASLVTTRRWKWTMVPHAFSIYLFVYVSNILLTYNAAYFNLTQAEVNAHATVSYANCMLLLMVEVLILNSNYVLSQFIHLPLFLICSNLQISKMEDSF